MSNEEKFWYLFWAYNIIWALITIYLISLGVRQQRLQKRIERLREKLGMTDGREEKST